MDIVQLKDRPDLKAIIAMVDPTWRKQKAILTTGRNEVQLSGTYWDGGTCNNYYLVNLKTRRCTPLPNYAPPQFGGPKEDPVQQLEDGFAVVRMGIFCGKPATPIIYLP